MHHFCTKGKNITRKLKKRHFASNLRASVQQERDFRVSQGKRNVQYGVELEPVINEAYQLLTGHVTRETGFWLPGEGRFRKKTT